MMLLVAATLTHPQALAAQQHEHAADAPSRNARLELMLGGPHLILYHRGYLALGDAQISGLLRLRRSVCEAELVFVQQSTMWRDRLTHILDDTASPPPRPTRDASSPPPRPTLNAKPSPLHDAMNGLASAESQWLTELMHARRGALALLSAQQRAQLSALREHWLRESNAMVEEATRPGQRGHPGTQIPIRVPGMVVHETTLLPHCEALHGPSRHIVIPPPV